MSKSSIIRRFGRGGLVRRSSGSGGFTLVEVILVVFMTAMIALMIAAIFPISQIARMKAVHKTYAMNLAQQKIEELKSAGYINVNLCSESTPVTPYLPGSTMDIVVTQYSTDVKKIQVDITWDGYRKIGGNVSLITFISDHS